jgi:hypothetical protein
MAHVKTRTIDTLFLAPASRLLLGGALSLACILAVAQNARAERPRLSTDTEQQAARPEQPVKVEKATFTHKRSHAYLGRAPYICTPSGFGTTASCFLRASVQ